MHVWNVEIIVLDLSCSETNFRRWKRSIIRRRATDYGHGNFSPRGFIFVRFKYKNRICLKPIVIVGFACVLDIKMYLNINVVLNTILRIDRCFFFFLFPHWLVQPETVALSFAETRPQGVRDPAEFQLLRIRERDEIVAVHERRQFVTSGGQQLVNQTMWAIINI